jgi:hypothetical protein
VRSAGKFRDKLKKDLLPGFLSMDRFWRQICIRKKSSYRCIQKLLSYNHDTQSLSLSLRVKFIQVAKEGNIESLKKFVADGLSLNVS